MLITVLFCLLVKLQLFLPESSHCILDIEEPLVFLFDRYDTGWEILRQQLPRALQFYLKAAVTKSWLGHHL